MRHVISEVTDDSHQECTNDVCNWQSGPCQEPFTLCPLCFHGLKIIVGKLTAALTIERMSPTDIMNMNNARKGP